jgi:dihydrofolate reductase
MPLQASVFIATSLDGYIARADGRIDWLLQAHAGIPAGETIRAFLQAGLIDDFVIPTIPVLLGSGRPLFGPLPADPPLQQVRTRSWPVGLVQSEYRRVGGA